MAQQAIDVARARSSLQTSSQTVPTLGLRGGLGKTLLIAFLLLAITPLSLLALLTYHQIQRDTGQKLMASLETMTSLKEAHLVDWVQGYERELALLASNLETLSTAAEPSAGSVADTQDSPATGASAAGSPGGAGQRLGQALSAYLAAARTTDPALAALILVDRKTGEIVAATGGAEIDARAWQPLSAGNRRLVIVSPGEVGAPIPAVSHAGTGMQLIGLLTWDALWQIVAEADSEAGITTSLITGDGWIASSDGLTLLPADRQAGTSTCVDQVMLGQNGSAACNNLAGTPVFSAYRWNPELKVALLAEQSQTQALATGNTLTAVVLGATLAVALITAASAAVVTRRLTIPIVQLTETAAWMARGDLNQTVCINRRDEIGVLARAFNRMAADLKILYSELEAKVSERTQQLQEATERIRYHATRLGLSAEVARVVTSIRDLDELLNAVVELIGRAFELNHASVYLLGDGHQWLVCRATTNPESSPEQEKVGGSTLIGRVASDGHRRVVRPSQPQTTVGLTAALCPPVECEMAVPLRVQHQVLGVLDLRSVRADDFDENDQMVYQSLADQISIAIENVRAYEAERKTVARLQELDRIQSQFLANMSHVLRTPLTSIIGFSRVMLKELDGPVTDLQRTDLNAIHQSGRQLLGLINDMLELSQLDLGTAPFSLAEVDLAEIIEGVMATARALAGGKPVELYQTVPADLPPLFTDGDRVRQVILALLSNAVKFTPQGSIHLCVTRDAGYLTISVSDTGAGISPVERAAILSDTRNGENSDERDAPGFGLAISKRVVQRLGGRIWLDSEEGNGSTFTFTLPIRPVKDKANDGVAEDAAEP